MNLNVVCLRPEADFKRVGTLPPKMLRVAYRASTDSDVAALLQQAHALVIPAVGSKLPATLFEGTKLKLVQVTGAGLDRLDQPALTQLGIAVANVPGGSNSAVAEYAVTAASFLLRRFGAADSAIRNGNYASYRAQMLVDNLAGVEGLLVGVVGFGTIGQAVARAFDRMGARICYYDTFPRDPAVLGTASMSLDELLAAADVVTLHVPLLPATQGLIGEREFSQMKTGAVLIQASRGGIVDEAALAAHLKSGHLGGAAVDVYSTEPPPMDNPLLTLDGEAARRLLLTPHVAGVTRQSSAFLLQSAWQNVERVLVRGEPPLNRVY